MASHSGDAIGFRIGGLAADVWDEFGVVCGEFGYVAVGGLLRNDFRKRWVLTVSGWNWAKTYGVR